MRTVGTSSRGEPVEAVPSHATRESTATLLWEACHRRPGPEAVREAIDNGANVPLAATTAIGDRIAPLLWRALDAAGALAGLGDLRAPLKEIVDVHRMEATLLLPRAVSKALVPLLDAGLEPLVLKGPAVAMRYPAPGLRPMDDLDVLLPPDQHAEALVALGEAGWQVAALAGPGRHDTALTHVDVPSLPLELHFDVRPAFRVHSLDAVALWEKRQPIDCFGTPAFGLPLAEELVVLATHAAKPLHHFRRLVWIADIAMIVGHAEEAGDEVAWARVREVAYAAGCATVVATTLELARHAGVDSPSELFAMPKARRRAEVLGRLTATDFPLARSSLAPWRLQYALTDDRRQRTRVLVHRIAGGHGMGERMRRARGSLPGGRRAPR